MKKIKVNLNSILTFLAGSVITFVGTTYAASQILASDVNFSPKDVSWKVTDAEAAINDLYYKVPGVPTGTILSIMGNTAPAGYVICDGTEYNISSHTNLAEYIKEQFGSYNYFGGDGATTFAVPDLRGEFLRGTGTATRNTGTGLAVGVHQDATSHNNGASFHNEATGTYISGQLYGTYTAAYYPSNTDKRTETSSNTWITSSTISIQSNTSKGITNYTSRPTNTSVLYIIKY